MLAREKYINATITFEHEWWKRNHWLLKSPSKNDTLNTLERLEAYGCTKNTKVQLKKMPHKQDILLIKGIQLVQMFGN